MQCNNCSIVHKVVDICKSEIVAGLEFSNAVTRLDEVQQGLPDNVASILTKANCDLATWENVAFLMETSLEGFEVPIAKEENAGLTQIKLLVVDKQGKAKVKTVTRNDFVDFNT